MSEELFSAGASARPRGESPFVLIVGGFSTPRAALLPLRAQVRAAGYETGIFVHRFGMDCSERTYERLLAHVTELRTRYPEVVVLAHSRGGQFVKVLAVRNPDSITAMVALCVAADTAQSTIRPMRSARDSASPRISSM